MQVRKTDAEKIADTLRGCFSILEALYPDEKYTWKELNKKISMDKGNLSRRLQNLDDAGLIERETVKGVKLIKLTVKAQPIVQAIIQAARKKPLEPWMPTSEEVAMLVKAFQAKQYKLQSAKALQNELKATLKSGYWDQQFEVFFDKALEKPEWFNHQIEQLISCSDYNVEAKEYLKQNVDKLFSLILNGMLFAFPPYIELSGEKGLQQIREVLSKKKFGTVKLSKDKPIRGRGILPSPQRIQNLMKALAVYANLFYEKHGVEAKKVLYDVLFNDSIEIREFASKALKTIAETHLKQ